MSLTNIKSRNRGFTIVELLIVVVVIAILAAITIVSYNGITKRANASASKAAAATVQKKIELYNTENSRYPISAAEMSASTSDSWYLATSNITASGADPTTTTGKTKVKVVSCGNATPDATNVTGVRIYYYDFDAGAVVTTPITLGTCTTPATTGWSGA